MDNPPSLPQEEIKEFLRPALFGLAEEDLDELARAANVCAFPPDEIICREGQPGNAVYVIVEGKVDISKRLDEENERYLRSQGPGELFGEMAILQEEGLRTATVRAAESTTLLEINREPFLAVLGRSPSLGIRILVSQTARLRDADQRAIAELRRSNERMARALRQMERLDQTKSDFIRLSAHELRTPVAALLGYTQMMRTHQKVQDDPKLRTLVDGIVTGTARLRRVFDSILDVSRVMTGALHVHRSPVSIPVIVESIGLEFRQALEDRNLTLDYEGVHGLPIFMGDPDLMYKVFYHLVNNGIKYTPDGGRITVTGHTENVPGLGRSVEVTVEDTGIGIAPQDLDLIFEKFYRTGEPELHSSGETTFKGGGPGLGLAIARGAVMAHGGRIWAESPGYDEKTCPGSKFIVQLPLTEEVHGHPTVSFGSSSSATTPSDSLSGR
jgi:signal transduction histidine kinase